ncbi:MAG: hypothetical protein RLZZ165_794 [Bacteroidota bacterium]|jgi:hypothetical protein
MTAEELEALMSSGLRSWVEAHLHDDPHRLAFQRHDVPFPVRLAVMQVALLQKAAAKLPRLAGHRCLLTQRAYEQSTSEVMASLKPWGEGAVALDLTCGIGIDSMAMAKHFTQVTALEPDASLAAMTRFNVRLLGIGNLTVLDMKAEAFLSDYAGPPFDLIYADPDRRDLNGKRVFGLGDCQPDLLRLLPLMRKHGKRILVKGSPMLDISALKRLFPKGAFFWVLSEANECKELLIEIDAPRSGCGAIFYRKGQAYQMAAFTPAEPMPYPMDGNPRFILEADAALYKAGIVRHWFQQQRMNGGMLSEEGYFYCDNDHPGFHGHRFRVRESWMWKPREIKAALRALGAQRIQYARRGFDLPVETVKKQIGLPEGGEWFLLLTKFRKGARWAFLAERIA